MRIARLITQFSLAAVIAVVVLATAYAGEGVPAISDTELEQALALAGGNQAQLTAALEHFPPASFANEAMRFLVAGLPLADLGTVTADYLVANVELAVQARDEMPYAQAYDDATWAHYVLPHRVSHYIDALRSVGIPARNTFCPWWSHCDNNHAWTEVYLDDGRWYCDEVVGQEDRSGGWVMAAARQASVVVNMCYGAAENPGAQLLRGSREPGARYTMLNSIVEYRDASTVELDFTGLLPDGSNTDAAGEECRVYIHVWNYGAMRPVAYVYIDEDLRARFAVGAGTYTLSTDAPVDTPVVVCRITPGEELSFHWGELPPAGDCMFAEYPRD
jgi:hypothetical protein